MFALDSARVIAANSPEAVGHPGDDRGSGSRLTVEFVEGLGGATAVVGVDEHDRHPFLLVAAQGQHVHAVPEEPIGHVGQQPDSIGRTEDQFVSQIERRHVVPTS